MKLKMKCRPELLVLFFFLAISQVTMASDKPSVHGMLVFGEKKIFFSHLPMFHSPHDYQAIFSAQLNEQIKDLYLSDKKSHPEEKIYTFVPEVMVLPDVVLKTKVFKGELYRGHFERGGSLIARDIQVTVGDVVVFKKFDPMAVKPLQLTYLLFGQPREYWLAHDIYKKPDFDHIIGVDLPDGIEIHQPAFVTVESTDPNKPLLEGKNIKAKVGNQSVQLESLRSVYLEFDDLSM